MEGMSAFDVEGVAELLIVKPKKNRQMWRKSGSIPCERINFGFSRLLWTAPLA
jgi:hypothetical protein